MAVSCVALTKVVASADGGLTTQSTTDPFTKFVPVTVRTTSDGLHDGVEFDEREPIVGPLIVNDIGLEAPPPGLSVNTLTLAVPVARKSAGGTIAVS